MATLLDPKCGANIASLTESQVRHCARLSWYIGGGILTVLGVGAACYLAASKTITWGVGAAIVVGLLAFFVIMTFVSSFIAARSKQSQMVDMEALKASGMTQAQAMQASFMERGMQAAASRDRTSEVGTTAAILGGGAELAASLMK